MSAAFQWSGKRRRWFAFTAAVLWSFPASAGAASFLRGDANQDGVVDVSDALTTLGFLFLGEPVELLCPAAADTTDDDILDLSDPVAGLNFLFLGGGPLPPPGALVCGLDPTPGALGCATSSPCDDSGLARVLDVAVSGVAGAYNFSVTVESPDAGCERYADWWEVLTAKEQLLYRRVLLHSHTNEQPFTRTGGPVGIPADAEVIVRVHLHPDGYALQGLAGSPAAGFLPVELAPDFATALAELEPLPEGCAF